ncbi:MAG: hypothetical protein K8H86_01745 [Ignavibacteriaceae bacterium]|nr:hypothetical protein [Ignavibacteriaceae bacterium]
MKNSIILWIAAFVVVFLTGYFESVTNESYPVTGTFGISGEKVSYKFNKVHYGNKPFHFFIRSDAKDINGFLFWRKEQNQDWKKENLRWVNDELYADIPAQKPETIIEYKAAVVYNNKTYRIPGDKIVFLKFIGEVPASIWGAFYFTLFAGLIIGVRTGLDYFNDKDKIRKLSLITVFFFFAYLLTIPLKTTFELGALNNRVPGFTELFSLQPVLLFINSFFVMIGLFNFKEKKITALIGAVIMISIFLFVRS